MATGCIAPCTDPCVRRHAWRAQEGDVRRLPPGRLGSNKVATCERTIAACAATDGFVVLEARVGAALACWMKQRASALGGMASWPCLTYESHQLRAIRAPARPVTTDGACAQDHLRTIQHLVGMTAKIMRDYGAQQQGVAAGAQQQQQQQALQTLAQFDRCNARLRDGRTAQELWCQMLAVQKG
jgi:hypothetical protein